MSAGKDRWEGAGQEDVASRGHPHARASLPCGLHRVSDLTTLHAAGTPQYVTPGLASAPICFMSFTWHSSRPGYLEQVSVVSVHSCHPSFPYPGYLISTVLAVRDGFRACGARKAVYACMCLPVSQTEPHTSQGFGSEF